MLSTVEVGGKWEVGAVEVGAVDVFLVLWTLRYTRDAYIRFLSCLTVEGEVNVTWCRNML